MGSGEGDHRNSVGHGNGVYRSLDGGKTWTHLGLEKTDRIKRIVVNPSNPDVACRFFAKRNIDLRIRIDDF